MWIYLLIAYYYTLLLTAWLICFRNFGAGVKLSMR